MKPSIESFFDGVTGTVSHVVYEQRGSACAIVDAVLDYDASSGRTGTASADCIMAFIKAQALQVQWLLETHVHADHISASPFLCRHLGGEIAIGAGLRHVQQVFNRVFTLGMNRPSEDITFDRLLDDGETFAIGQLQARALHVPGHTPADMAYVIGEEAVFVGDILFMPDVGTARCDFPGGNARQLYQSIQRLLALPPATRLYLCHDYPTAGRDPAWQCTVAQQRAGNIHVLEGVDEDSFVAMRQARDETLALPTLMLPALQLNVLAGVLPTPQGNGIRYLQIPLDTF